MKKNILKAVGLLFIVVFAVAALGCGGKPAAKEEAAKGEKKVVRVAFTNYYVPYDFVNKAGEPDGIEVQIMKEVAKSLPQYQFKFEPTSDDDLLIGVESGKYDVGIKGVWQTEARKTKFIFPKKPIAASVIGLTFRKSDADKIKDMESFAQIGGKLVPIAPQNAQYAIVEEFNKKNAATETVKIGLVGKYVELQDAYKSIDESLLHAAIYNDRKLDLYLFHSEKITDENAASQLADMDGILIAPGFGQRGIEGKFSAIKFARENNKPLFGICLGMQCMVIEFARNVLGYSDANSTEMEPNTPHKVIDMMEEQKTVINLGGSMRLGAFDCVLKKDSKAFQAYEKEHIQERHRHRFEFNNEYKGEFEAAGMKCVGTNPDTNLVEVVEIPDLKWFVGVQYHPEYNSTVVNPNPLFISFIKAAINNK